jgi:hypothetical protein
MYDKRGYFTLSGKLMAELIFSGSNVEGADVLGFEFDGNTNTWKVFFVHPELAEVPEGEETPEVEVKYDFMKKVEEVKAEEKAEVKDGTND